MFFLIECYENQIKVIDHFSTIFEIPDVMTDYIKMNMYIYIDDLRIMQLADDDDSIYLFNHKYNSFVLIHNGSIKGCVEIVEY